MRLTNPSPDAKEIPRHIAVIMDGNGRWAKKRQLPRSAGHKAGLKRMISLAKHAFSLGVKTVTLFALSTENLSRPQEEVDALFSLFRQYFTENVTQLQKNGIKLKVIGNRALLPEDVQALIRAGEKDTASGREGAIVLAIAYGGRQTILSAVNAAVRAGVEVDERAFSALLGTDEFPEPDLLIRTGGEKRLSNFLLWELAYTEFYFSDKMFPAFTNGDLDKAIAEFNKRDRRFGKV